MNFKQAIISILNIKGRAEKSEYQHWGNFKWLIELIIIIPMLVKVIDFIKFGTPTAIRDLILLGFFVGFILPVFLFLPYRALECRRLHDIGKSGTIVLIETILYFIFFISLYFLLDIPKINDDFRWLGNYLQSTKIDGMDDYDIQALKILLFAITDDYNSELQTLRTLLLIVFVSGIIASLIHFTIWLKCNYKDGTPGDNKYGPNPKERRISDELQKYNKMFEDGLINEKEFNEMKSKLLER